MPREVGMWLEDILTHGQDALEFIEGRSEADYFEDKALRAMVERKLFVVGEAVSQIRNQFPDVVERLTGSREIVGFRNLLAHGYFELDHRRVYDIAKNSLPGLLTTVESILVETEEAEEG